VTQFLPILEQIARTGVLEKSYQWENVRTLILIRIIQIMRQFLNNDPQSQTNENIRDTETFEARWARIQENIKEFANGPPFTIQRLAELALDPRYYSTPSGYLLAITKCVSGISSEWREEENGSEEEEENEIEDWEENNQEIENENASDRQNPPQSSQSSISLTQPSSQSSLLHDINTLMPLDNLPIATTTVHTNQNENKQSIPMRASEVQHKMETD